MLETFTKETILAKIVETIKKKFIYDGVTVDSRPGVNSENKKEGDIVLFVTNTKTNRREQKAVINICKHDDCFRLNLDPSEWDSITYYIGPNDTEECYLEIADYFSFSLPN